MGEEIVECESPFRKTIEKRTRYRTERIGDVSVEEDNEDNNNESLMHLDKDDKRVEVGRPRPLK